MAEMVKKSRIVSEGEDNLEETLIEEFNLRLKECMSRENMQQNQNETEAGTNDVHIYENVDTNGLIPTITDLKQTDENLNQEFLNMERQNYDDCISNGHKEDLELEICSLDKNSSTKTDANVEQTVEISLEKPSLNLPTTCLIDSSESTDTDNPDLKSVKDRMFLSTDDASCLLFTQTVTSPMLTPSEENIDFLKGLRRESSQNNLSDTKEEASISTRPEQSSEVTTTEKAIVENIYENVEDLKESTQESPDLKEETSKFLEMEVTSTERTSDSQETNGEIDNSKGNDDLKSLNIMKQITKFENNVVTNQCEEITNVCSNLDVSTITQSQYVETSTEIQSTGEVNNIKKKKTKKSKNQHEKENISVNKTTNIYEEESIYNVNVKNLCRSFGDLTKIEGDHRSIKNNERLRTKSLSDVRSVDLSKKIENVFGGVSVKALKSSFSKFDALQKKNILNSHSAITDNDNTNCKKCGKPVFQMERIIAEKSTWHRNCFRCIECSKQLLVDNFESHEGTLYCKPHFKALFAPKVVEDDVPAKPRKHELIIRENQPAELPPDVARASDKPDLGLEELHCLNVKERFQVFENAKGTTDLQTEKNTIKMERSRSILSKLARFQAKGMNVGVSDDALNGVAFEPSSSEEEEEEEEIDGEDADLVRAKKVQKEKPFHFSQMSDVKSKWEQGNQQKKDDLREERKQEIQNIRSRLFLGKQGKMKEAYQQAVVESEAGANVKKEIAIEVTDTRSLKDKFERGDVAVHENKSMESEDMSVFESGISKKSRSIFQELDATGGKPPKLSPTTPTSLGNSMRSAREAFLAKQSSEDTVRSSDQVDEISVRTADIQDRFKFFETYKEPQQKRKEFRITPPREGQVKSKTPEREVYMDPDIVRSEDYIEDSVVAKATHTATKMLNKFRQMEENLSKGQDTQGPKPLKRFTPPREPIRCESSSGEECESEEESADELDNSKLPEQDLIEAQKAARAKKLRAKFERWEENEIKRENSINIAEEIGEDQSQLETAKSLRAKFESLRDTNSSQKQSSRVKVNRFVGVTTDPMFCKSCDLKVYPLEMITVHGLCFHKNCFRCKECKAVLRMDSYSYNQGLLYCTTHFKRLFISKGNYDTAFGLNQHKEKWNMSIA